jgi:hypothetical protein
VEQLDRYAMMPRRRGRRFFGVCFEGCCAVIDPATSSSLSL